MLSTNNQLKLKEAETQQIRAAAESERVDARRSSASSPRLEAGAGTFPETSSSGQKSTTGSLVWIRREIGMTFELFLSLVHPDDRETVRRQRGTGTSRSSTL